MYTNYDISIEECECTVKHNYATVLSPDELLQFLNDFCYNSYIIPLKTYIYALIVECPYDLITITKVLIQWWNVRDHDDFDIRLINTIKNYNYKNSPHCFKNMLKSLTIPEQKEKWSEIINTRLKYI